jgi:hypothetical protein
MTRLLYILPFAIVLAVGSPTLCLADDMADECRKLAAEEEVAPEDMDDYIAECLAVIQSDSPEDLEDMENMEKMAEPVPGGEGEKGVAPMEEAAPEHQAPVQTQSASPVTSPVKK